MADITVTADQVGAYEFAIPANTTVTVEIAAPTIPIARPNVIELINHGTVPIYARRGNQVAVRDQFSRIFGPGEFDDFAVEYDGSLAIAITAAADTTASVRRRVR